MSLPVVCRTRSKSWWYFSGLRSWHMTLTRTISKTILALASMIWTQPGTIQIDLTWEYCPSLEVGHVKMETEADHEYATIIMDVVLDDCGLTLQDAQAWTRRSSQVRENWADATNKPSDVSYLYDMFHTSTESDCSHNYNNLPLCNKIIWLWWIHKDLKQKQLTRRAVSAHDPGYFWFIRRALRVSPRYNIECIDEWVIGWCMANADPRDNNVKGSQLCETTIHLSTILWRAGTQRLEESIPRFFEIIQML